MLYVLDRVRRPVGRSIRAQSVFNDGNDKAREGRDQLPIWHSKPLWKMQLACAGVRPLAIRTGGSNAPLEMPLTFGSLGNTAAAKIKRLSFNDSQIVGSE
jgi:hypothetical protein